ncbi:MAG: hypothetical protein J6Z31_03140 [Fibrobacter sp.]|nr:hypothetical protein [Fibrobacter sp.]
MIKQMNLWMMAGALCAAFATADILPETEGMLDTRYDGTFLTASPTYVYDRSSQMGGIHSESEEWSPSKVRDRILFNRVSGTPSWTPLEPSVWMSVGNEIGDLMYQDPRHGGWSSGNENGTPMLEAGYRSKSYSGIWTTARYFQVDHYSVSNWKIRSKMVNRMDYSIFGENLPYQSTAYAGFGYSSGSFESSLLAGHEYLWIFAESGRWLPVEYKPRAEARFDTKYLHGNVAFENAEYTVLAGEHVGNRKEISGSIKLGEDSIAKKKKLWNLGLGVAFRAVDDSGSMPVGIKDDYVVFPYLEYSLRPTDRLSFAGFIGTSGREFSSKDSVNLEFPEVVGAKTNVGFKNHVASTLNPLGEDYEYLDSDTIHLRADGVMQLHRAYLDVQGRAGYFGLGMNIAGWFEKGAETFNVESYSTDEANISSGKQNVTYRTGDVERIDSWIKGFSGEANVAFYYKKMFLLNARAGFERIDGEEERFEVNPVEEWISIGADWNLWNHFKIQHAWAYRSDAQWNLRTEDPYVVKGSWYWDASFSQVFPEYGITLKGTILHALGKHRMLVPNGGRDKTRFWCNIVKTF